MSFKEKVSEIITVIHKRAPGFEPKIALVLGSGLDGLIDDIKVVAHIDYKDLPHFAMSSVQGHAGCLVLGYISDMPIMCFKGRIHFYEGGSFESIKLIVRTVKDMGCYSLILMNGCGSLRKEVGAGEAGLITDHINLQLTNPLIGVNDDEYGGRFVTMNDAYDPGLNEIFRQTAKALKITLYDGVYMGLSGPCFETPAEIRAFRTLGADYVGMSTVPEVILARHCGLKVTALTAIVNIASGMSDVNPSHAETLAKAQISGEKLRRILKEFLSRI